MLTRNLILAAAGALALLAAAPAAHADGWDRGWHGHGHGGWHGYGWRPYGGYVYAPPPVYYAPPPVYYAPPPAYYAPPPAVVIAPRIPMPFVAFGFN
jgi:hypothetical protein